ncbi:hypothetical protein Q3G72_019265 [Acer saccharum]|nr:hypothetical protein Q3G72_019265 [Acer saccharum]
MMPSVENQYLKKKESCEDIVEIISLHDSQASRFILFVITPEWLANGLRDDIVGGFFCLIIGVLLGIAEIRSRYSECTSSYCFGYCLGLAFLFLFTILYLGKEI